MTETATLTGRTSVPTVSVPDGCAVLDYWVPADWVQTPLRWKAGYRGAAERYGFVEVSPPDIWTDGSGGFVARGVVRRGDLPPG